MCVCVGGGGGGGGGKHHEKLVSMQIVKGSFRTTMYTVKPTSF